MFLCLYHNLTIFQCLSNLSNLFLFVYLGIKYRSVCAANNCTFDDVLSYVTRFIMSSVLLFLLVIQVITALWPVFFMSVLFGARRLSYVTCLLFGEWQQQYCNAFEYVMIKFFKGFKGF